MWEDALTKAKHAEDKTKLKTNMAYMNQEKKSLIHSELKKVVPKTWKWSLSVSHHSTIVFTVSKAPSKELGEYDGKSVQVNTYCPEKYFAGEVLATAKAVIAALNKSNHNRSDTQSDYFDVGHYVDFNIGRWDNPFKVA